MSAIGHLSTATRTYVSQSRSNSVFESTPTFQNHRQKNTDTYTSYSAPVNSAPSGLDRSSRLKGREESGIKWHDLLEKFRSVQDRARRSLRAVAELNDGFEINKFRTGQTLDDRTLKDLSRIHGSSLPVKEIPAAQTGNQKQKGSLGNFRRLGGAMQGGRHKK